MSAIYDLTAMICERGGNPMCNDDNTPTTIGRAIVRALDLTNDTQQLAEKTERYSIATRIYESFNKSDGKVELRATEVDTIKTVVSKTYPPLILAQVIATLEEQKKAAS